MTALLCLGQMDRIVIFSHRHQLFKDRPTKHILCNSDPSAAVVLKVSKQLTWFTYFPFHILVSTTGIHYISNGASVNYLLIISSSLMTASLMAIITTLLLMCPCFMTVPPCVEKQPNESWEPSASTCITEELSMKDRENVCLCVCLCHCLHLHVDDVTRPFVCTLIFMHECVYMGDIVTSLSVCSDNRWVNGSFVTD